MLNNTRNTAHSVVFRYRGRALSSSNLISCEHVVEQMLSDRRPLAEVEEYIEDCSLDEMEKAGLWMLAWAHQDKATQLRLAREMLALASTLSSTAA